MNEPTDRVVELIVAVVEAALDRCDREGVAWKDFYAAFRAEYRLCPTGSLPTLIASTFARLKESK